jgi:hypothetical protein
MRPGSAQDAHAPDKEGLPEKSHRGSKEAIHDLFVARPPPENSANVNKKQLGNLGLTNQEEDALVAFLKALTDGQRIEKR